MALFGKAAVTKTTVKPAWQTEQILRDVVNRSAQNQQNQHFIGHDMANMDEDYRGALAQLAASPELQRGANLLSGQTSQGLANLGRSNEALQSILNNPVTADQVNQFRSSMTGPGSLSSRSVGQGTHAGNAVSALGGSAALRSAGRFNTSNINATQQNARSQQMAGLGARNAFGNQDYLSNVAQLGSNTGRMGVNLGGLGTNMSQQAIQNALTSGNMQQQYQQAQNQNTWQNQMGQQQFAWNQLNNRLNVLNSVSPMAGYTQKGVGAAPSMGAQLYGAGMTGLGIYGKLGGFNSMDKFDAQGNAANPFLNHSTAAAQPGGGPTMPGQASSYGGLFGGAANWLSGLGG